jgi:hypothetical protein
VSQNPLLYFTPKSPKGDFLSYKCFRTPLGGSGGKSNILRHPYFRIIVIKNQAKIINLFKKVYKQEKKV